MDVRQLDLGALPCKVCLIRGCAARDGIEALVGLQAMDATRADFWQSARRMFERTEDGDDGFTMSDGGSHLVWVGSDDVSLLAHELTHVVFASFKHCGVPITVSNQETFAYTIQHLMYQATKESSDGQHK